MGDSSFSFQVETTNFLSPGYLSLLNNIFFSNRKTTPKTSFPWLFSSSHEVYFFTIKNQYDDIVAGLTVKEVTFDNSSIGMIGLVCVDKLFRG